MPDGERKPSHPAQEPIQQDHLTHCGVDGSSNVVDGGAICRPSAPVDPAQPALGVKDHVATELAWVFTDTSETAATCQCAGEADPVSRSDGCEPPPPSSESEYAVCDSIRVAQDRDAQVQPAFEDRDRGRRRKRDADDTAFDGVSLGSDLHEVLVAGDSAEVAHEHQHHGLAAKRREPDLEPVGGGKDEVGDGGSDVHGPDTADREAVWQAGSIARTGGQGVPALQTAERFERSGIGSCLAVVDTPVS